MKLKQRFTRVGKFGLLFFVAGPIISYGMREWLIAYLKSLRGTGLTEVPDVTLYHAVIIAGVVMFLASIPMMIAGREYEGTNEPEDNGLWR
ncbi:hypothetical protein V6R98_27320 [Agrobacterium sp. CCNWLW71]|uniref:hypothetical protein n=1 Tax=Rhizobium/Agrobacterium group TaxID=227290 RepID=UPI0022B638A9|nr:hypothetical protein [Rhizobium rhizogenes]MCZ7451033.1 hypothetical protein [Rhizobium rhizogenes]